MKFSIVAVALLAAIIGRASPIPDTEVASDSVRNEDSSTLSTDNSIPDAPLVVVSPDSSLRPVPDNADGRSLQLFSTLQL